MGLFEENIPPAEFCDEKGNMTVKQENRGEYIEGIKFRGIHGKDGIRNHFRHRGKLKKKKRGRGQPWGDQKNRMKSKQSY